MHILSIALGGCLKAEPVRYGITEDTGGHITYILGEMEALASKDEVSLAEIVTRRFEDARLGSEHAEPVEWIAPKCRITRIDSGNPRYLAKQDLTADREDFTAALLADLRSRERLPDLIHAHFADAADVARTIERELGIPYVYTAHSLGIDKQQALARPCEALAARIAEEDRAIAGASAIVGSSRDECERQLLAYPSASIDRIHRIEPGARPPCSSKAARDAAAALIAPFLRDPAKPIVLAIARPVEKKNLAALIEAFGSEPTLREKANLVILAGQREASDEGEAEQVSVVTDLLHAIDRHDLYGHVAYPKAHDSDAVAGLYQLAASSGGVFVNPALMEPYGLTVVEAATYGLPVVATRVGGPFDIVGSLRHGELVDPRSRDDIAAAIGALLSDKQRWRDCAREGRARSQRLSWERYADRFLKVARGVLDTRSLAASANSAPPQSLLVSDLDNTLTGCRDGVAQLRAFLAGSEPFGFVISTGRSIIEARRIAAEWDIPEPLAWITSVGTRLHWRRGDRLEQDERFLAADHPGWDPNHIDALMARIEGVVRQADYEQNAHKRSYFYDSETTIAAVRGHIARAGLTARVVPSHGNLLDILPHAAGKAKAMDHVGETLGIAPSAIFAAGDSGNDRDMLRACENAILVANHAPEIASLSQRANVFVSSRPHAAGIVEGIEARLAQQDAPRQRAGLAG